MIQLLAVFAALALSPAQGGVCWLTHSSRGRCQQIDRLSVSREECCQSRNLRAAWSDHTRAELMRPGQFFIWEELEGGADRCQPCHSSCANVECAPNKRCVMKGGRPRCICYPDCNEANARHQGAVCGFDGRTYSSNCSLLRYNCRKERDVRVDYVGRCQQSCNKVVCPAGKNCVLDQNSLPHCIPCTPLFVCQQRKSNQELCGVDGKTYQSNCYYRRASCLSGQAIGIAYYGQCKDSATCADITCGRSQQCLTHHVTRKPKCVTCGQPCLPTESASEVICGSDNRNYYSWCEMQQAACRSGVFVETRHMGPCSSSSDTVSVDYYEEIEGDEYDYDVTL